MTCITLAMQCKDEEEREERMCLQIDKNPPTRRFLFFFVDLSDQISSLLFLLFPSSFSPLDDKH